MNNSKTPEHPPKIKILANDVLHKMCTKRLINILRMTTAVISHINKYYGPRCCSHCLEYIGEDWENDVARHSAPYVDYKKEIKDILATREDLDKKPKRKRKKRYRGRKDKGLKP